MKELKSINSRKSIAGTEASKGICKGNSTRGIFPSYRCNWSARGLSKSHTDTHALCLLCAHPERAGTAPTCKCRPGCTESGGADALP